MLIQTIYIRIDWIYLAQYSINQNHLQTKYRDINRINEQLSQMKKLECDKYIKDNIGIMEKAAENNSK